MATELPAKRTAHSAEDVELALITQWYGRYGEEVDPRVLRLLIALWDLETGTGRSSYHWNLGNVVVGQSKRDWFRLKNRATGEFTPHHYRVYRDLDDGAQDLIRTVRSPTRPQWEAGLLSGEPDMFVRGLKGVLPGWPKGPEYFEADLERYRLAFRSRWNRYPHLVRGRYRLAEKPRESNGMGWLLLFGGLGLYALKKLS